MKKIFTLALAAAAALGAQAADFVVYDNGELTPGLNVYGWYASGMDFTADAPGLTDAKAYKFFADNGGADASMGIHVSGEDLKTGPFHSATLNFNWYAEGTGEYTVRLTAETGAEQNYTFTVDADNAGKWNETSLSIAETYPTIAQQWDDFVGKGAGYIFSIIVTKASADAAIYFSKIYYSDLDEEWVAPELPELPVPAGVPVPGYAAEDVVSVFGPAYTPACTFNVGSWGQTTVYSTVEIAGSTVALLKNFNYLGWELNGTIDVSGCKYMCVEFFPCEETGFGFTPISAGPKEKTWIATDITVGEWNCYQMELSYFDVVDLSAVFQIKFDQGSKGAQCYLGNVYFVKDSSGIENVSAAAEAPARYFRLDGVEVAGQLPAGIYVKLQGDKASKVSVR